jgi:fibronectin-binding autotransporter adhesin
MPSMRKATKRSNARVLTSLVFLQQLTSAGAASANGLAHNAFVGSLPLNHSHNNFAATHASAQQSVHSTSSSASSAWGQNFNASALAGMASSSMLPASFGIGLTSLPLPSQSVPVGNASHLAGSFARSLQSQHTASQHSLSSLNASNLRHATSSSIAGAQLSAPLQVIQLDLTSSAATISLSAGVIKHGADVSIQVGGNSVSFRPGDKVTAAELVAIEQVQAKGGQTILLDGQGRASGGTFSLNSVSTGSNGLNVASVVVPANVTAVDRVTLHNNISLSGDLVNYGSILEVGRGHGGSANISALDIVNEAGGSIVTSGGGRAGLDLNLTASQDFTNMGTISSSGALSVSAGGSLTNAPSVHTSAISALAPSMTAAHDVNLQAANIVNTGTISSTSGNINLGTAGDQIMNVNNTGGTLSTANGAINVRDAGYAGLSNTNVVGGDLLSQQLNLNSGGGTINVNVGQLTGTVNSTGTAVHVKAETKDLKLGSQNLSGDPLYVNDSGDINISGNVAVGENLTYIASGNIIADNTVHLIGALDSVTGQGASITMVAGANVSGTTGINATFDGASGTGGNIDFSQAPSDLFITSASTKGGFAGGNQTYAAYASQGSKGQILMPTGSTMNAQGNGSGASGNILVLGGSSSATAITLGTITGRNIQIASSQPSIAGSGAVTYDGTGALTSTNVLARDNSIANGAVQVQQITGTGSVSIDGGNVSTLGPISTTGAVAITARGNLTVGGSLVTNGGSLTLVAENSIVSSGSQTINISTSSNSGGGDILIAAGAAFNTITPSQLSIFGRTASGGSIDFATAPIASLTSAGGAAGAKGGNITLAAFESASTSGLNGSVTTPANLFVRSGGGSSSDASGNITVVASNNNPLGNGIGTVSSPFSVDTTGGAIHTGNVVLSSSNPDFSTNINVNTNSATYSGGSFVGGPLTLSPVVYGVIATNFAQATILQASDLAVSLASVQNTNMLYVSGGSIATGVVNTKQSLALAAGENILINGNVTATGGLLLVAGGDIAVLGAGLQVKTSSSSTNSGAVTMIAGADFDVNGGKIVINGASPTGGSVNLFTDSTDYVQSIDTSSSSLSVTNGGNITLAAFAGSVSGSGAVISSTGFVANTGSTFGFGGDFSVFAGGLSGNVISLGQVTTSGAVTSTAGTIFLQTASPVTANLAYNIDASLSSGAPGNDATANFNSGAVVVTNSLESKGGLIVVNAGGDVQINKVIFNGEENRGDGSAGGFTVSSGSTTDKLNLGGTIADGNSFVSNILGTSDANTFGAGGTLIVNETGGAGIRVVDDQKIFIIPLGSASVRGASFIFNAGNGILDLGNESQWIDSSILAGPVIQGGNIEFTGYDIISHGVGAIELESLGLHTGGIASLTFTGPGDRSIKSGNGGYMLLAKGGGGTISLTTPGNLTVDAKYIEVGPLPTDNADGGNIHFVSGGNLKITGDLSVNSGSKGGNGGSIYLESASPTTFTVSGGTTLSKVNGLTGSISMTGVNAPGSLTVINDKGAIVNKQSLKNNFSSLTEAGAGLTFTGDIGGPAAQHISLTSHDDALGRATALSVSNKLIAADVHLEADGKITAANVNTSNLTFRGFTDVAITNTSNQTLTIGQNTYDPQSQDNYGAKVTINSAGNIIVAGQINVEALTLKSTGAAGSNYTIRVNDDIFAYTTTTIQAPGNITINSPVTGLTGITVTTTDPNSPITVNAALSAGAATKGGGDIKLISTGNINDSATISGRSVSLTSNAKTGTTATIGGVITASGTVTIKAPGAININSAIDGKLDITIANTDTTASVTVNAPITAAPGAQGGDVVITTPGNLTVNAAITSSQVLLTSNGKVGSHSSVTVNDDLTASLGVAIAAPGAITINGNITGGSVGLVNSEAGAAIKYYGLLDAGATGSVGILSKLGDIVGGPISQIDGGGTVSVTATKGALDVGAIGQTSAPNKISIRPLRPKLPAPALQALATSIWVGRLLVRQRQVQSSLLLRQLAQSMTTITRP